MPKLTIKIIAAVKASPLKESEIIGAIQAASPAPLLENPRLSEVRRRRYQRRDMRPEE